MQFMARWRQWERFLANPSGGVSHAIPFEPVAEASRLSLHHFYDRNPVTTHAFVPNDAVNGQPNIVGPVGKIRGTGGCILLCIVTLGIYTLYWYYKTHDEMKQHSNQGLGGGIALVLAIFVSIAMPYVTSSEVGNLYRARGQNAPVSGATGLWSFPGAFILIGPLVWFVKTNGALNSYWRSVDNN